jgi:gliding motility-associated transport system ATP-binding protein
VIEIQELTKYYGEKKAVGPLTFRIEKGEVVGLLGLNGAGKTTTLRILSSDLLPTSGKVMVDGVDLVDRPDKVQPRIGYLPDRPPLYGEMTVREYLDFAARLRGMDPQQVGKRVDEVVGITELGNHQHDRIDTLSHGFRQRVGIAQAIVHRPSLLLLDEPISGLDPKQIIEMRGIIRSFRGEHTTVLSSHILPEIQETCDRLLIIRDGAIVAEGTEQELTAGFEITMRMPDGAQAATAGEVIEGFEGVTSVAAMAEHEGGDGVARFRVVGTRDVREELCKKLVQDGYGILGLEKSLRGLERAFMEIAGEKEVES